MNTALDQDTLEILGLAFRDARSPELNEPLPEKLRMLWEKLGRCEGGGTDAAPYHSEISGRDGGRHARA